MVFFSIEICFIRLFKQDKYKRNVSMDEQKKLESLTKFDREESQSYFLMISTLLKKKEI